MRRMIDLLGHRGARGLFPENTPAGFAGALGIGVDAFELDVAVTADGVPVVSHDPALNPDITRGPDGKWLTERGPLIRRLRLAELAAYDVGRIRPGSDYAAQFSEQVPCDGARIPTLAEVLGANPAVRFNIELKTDPTRPDWTVGPVAMAEAVIAVARAADAIGRIGLASFDWRGLRHARRQHPDLPLVWLTSPERVADAALWWDGPVPADYGGSVPRVVAAEGGPIWSPHHADLTAGLIAEAHTLGLTVLPWTVNGAEDMRRLLRAGIDGLVTDRPDIARQVLTAEGFLHPPRVSAMGTAVGHTACRVQQRVADVPMTAPGYPPRKLADAVARSSNVCNAGFFSLSQAISVAIGA
jgi:glycerophosphoryl diester phosphodiesterase